MASVAFVRTSVRGDWRVRTGGIPSGGGWGQARPRGCLGAGASGPRLVRAVGGFWEKACACGGGRWMGPGFCLADFVYLVRELRSDCVRLSNKYAKLVMPSARFLNQRDRVRET